MTDWKDRAEVVEQENERLRDRIAALEDALGLTREYPPALGLNLTPTEGRMLSMMLARGYVQKQAFMSMLYDSRPDDAPEPKIIDVLICKLRPKLKKLCGVSIETKWGEGFYIPANQKAALRAALGDTPPVETASESAQ